jgi:hypothetical protein
MTNTIMPSGVICYEDIANIVEALINTEGRRYPIPGMEHEDIAQEIRLECIRVLPFYDASRIGPSPYKYLQTCVRNFLYNMRRGIWVPNNPPCVRCPLWNKALRICTIDEIGCDKIVQYRNNMAIKADLRRPASIEEDIFVIQENNSVIILDQSIRDNLPSNLIPFYEKMINGEQISNRIKKQIRTIVTDIINNSDA